MTSAPEGTDEGGVKGRPSVAARGGVRASVSGRPTVGANGVSRVEVGEALGSLPRGDIEGDPAAAVDPQAADTGRSSGLPDAVPGSGAGVPGSGSGDAVPQASLREIAGRRAEAYDAVYTDWHAKRITIESYESSNCYFLDVPPDAFGHINGNEIRFAQQLIGVDDLSGRTILDYCCGAGRSAIYFALKGARVLGCDRSATAVALARQSAALSGVADRVCFSVMDVQDLAFPDGAFDAVYCQSALHIIIDYSSCARELARVLRPGGVAVFCEEALGHNPFIEMVRYFRRRKYKSCGGRTLKYQDILAFGSCFDQTRIHHFNLFSQIKQFLGSSARRRGMRMGLRGLRNVDRWVLGALPFMKRFCGKVVVEYRKAVE